MKIAIIIIIIIWLIWRIYLYNNAIFLRDKYRANNTITFGAKGKGKDLIFQKVITMRKKEPYLANGYYGYNMIPLKMNDLSVEPNTYENFINGHVIKVKKTDEWEGLDVYISDGGVYLPSQYDNLLSKSYKSLPILYATSRHLYNMNIHINTQQIGRIWVKLREQADFYIMARGTTKIFGRLYTRFTFYDRVESAEQRLAPLKMGLFNRFDKAIVKEYVARNGVIKNGIIMQKIKSLKYDTRAFHKIIFGYKYEMKKERDIWEREIWEAENE